MPEPISPTNENFRAFAVAPLMRWLIDAALSNDVLTYGKAKNLLEEEENFSDIFTKTMGKPAGAMIDRILEADPAAPLLNVLLVSQADRMPSAGAGWYMAERYGVERLKWKGARESKLWREYFDIAAQEVYRYTPEQWSELYKKVFSEPLSPANLKQKLQSAKNGREKDGIPTERHGEGPNHKALRLWVRDNPGLIRGKYAKARVNTEFVLESADRVDVMYWCSDSTVAIEVKSRDSNYADFMRGVYQCVKYRAVLAAQDIRRDAVIEVLLVTETEVPGEIKALLKIHQIKHFLAPMERA